MSSIQQRVPAAIDHVIFLFHTWMRMVKKHDTRVTILMLSQQIGCVIAIQLNTWEFGKVYIILLLNPLEFEGFKKEAGLNAFTLSPKKWIDTTNAIGLIAKSGRYGGTYAHKDIAFSLSEFICATCINEQNYISFMKPASLVIETGFIDS